MGRYRKDTQLSRKRSAEMQELTERLRISIQKNRERLKKKGERGNSGEHDPRNRVCPVQRPTDTGLTPQENAVNIEH